MVMYFPPKNYDPRLIRFLAALCAGFAGGFLSGQALFNMEATLSTGFKFTISGAAGTALFFTIWFFWKNVDANLKDGVNSIFIPAGLAFQAAVSNIAKTRQTFAQFKGFTPAQLNLPLTEGQIKGNSPQDSMAKLRFLNDQLPNYTVKEEGSIYILQTEKP